MMIKKYIARITPLFLALSLNFCAAKQEVESTFPQEIESVFYQKHAPEISNKGLQLYISFKNPLAKNITLKKIYFHSQEIPIKAISSKDFYAFSEETLEQHDFNLNSDPAKEYGNKAPQLLKNKFALEPNEGVLEYEQNHKTHFFKIKTIIQKPL